MRQLRANIEWHQLKNQHCMNQLTKKQSEFINIDSYIHTRHKEISHHTCKRMFDTESNYIMASRNKTKYTKCNEKY